MRARRGVHAATPARAMPPCPDALLQSHVWPRVHQLRLRAALADVGRAGTSFYEDLPDLVDAWDTANRWRRVRERFSPRGWSQRVTEFHQDLAAAGPPHALDFLGPPAAAGTPPRTVIVRMEVAQGGEPTEISPSPPAPPAAPGQVTLVSQEGTPFVVPPKVASMSVLVRAMLEESMSTDDEDEPAEAEAPADIPLPNVAAPVLEKVLAFCRHHVDAPMPEIEKPLRSENMYEVVDAWDAAFVDVDQDALFELILAANYMDIPSLLDLGTAKVASLIKGKTPEEIRQTFGIVNDFTPEEEAEVRAENEWCEDLEAQEDHAAAQAGADVEA